MRGLCIGSLGLTLGLLVSSASAQDTPWRAISPTPTASPQPATDAGSGSSAVTLRPPVVMSDGPSGAAVQQTSFIDLAPLAGRTLVIADPQPLPIGPALREEKAPPPRLVYPPSGGNTDDSWGSVVSRWVGGDVDGAKPVSPLAGGDSFSGPSGGDPGGFWAHNLGWDGASCGGLCGGSCGDGCCDGCCGGNCMPKGNCFWLRAEYLLWTVKPMGLPALVTVNNQGNNPVFGNDGTAAAFRDNDFGTNLRSGGRFTLGFDLPCLCNTAFETTGFFLGTRSASLSLGSDGSPTIGRPFIQTGPGQTPFPGNQDAEIVAGFGTRGTVTLSTSSELWGIEANLRHNLCGGCCWNVDFLWGMRYLSLTETLRMSENLVTSVDQFQFNQQVFDQFRTRNNFYGGQIGLDAEYRWGRWFVGGTGKLAMGGMHQTVDINGGTSIASPFFNGQFAGGLLALPTNMGRYGRDTFAIVPELDLKLGYNFTKRLRGFVGYNVVYVSSVVRPGDIVDTHVNTNFLPGGNQSGPRQPEFQFRTTDFWAQGACFGLEWRY